ncbi:unnamed protein product [Tilletia controversa]|uniref:acetate--CoA ligase n=1 Tax=Tilletia laevis TaxID=157183 RepID=A0A9N8MAT2_9BASI|nr:unnamed protein product [Tilletia caries]CAD6950275.1 unnamed protein product [Tilletia laevis]CAD6955052.1 unnamed protein product [Tilletia controversa]CAD6965570.1 unnamed protein product [Tilletia laevis]CAD6970424.1 unnamed protein product [Tilletia controversa]
MIPNHWPYNIPLKCRHWCVWSRKPITHIAQLPSAPDNPDGPVQHTSSTNGHGHAQANERVAPSSLESLPSSSSSSKLAHVPRARPASLGHTQLPPQNDCLSGSLSAGPPPPRPVRCSAGSSSGRSRSAQEARRQEVIIYLPMIPEAIVSLLACARIGAVHSVVFAGFSAESLRDRANDCEARVLITTDEGKRGGRTICLFP